MDGNVVYRGLQAAERLLSRQLAAIKKLKAHTITVKVNSIVIPGINDHHVEVVARTMKALGIDLFNCMAMFPNVNTPFGDIEQPDKKLMETLRSRAEAYLPQMRHCTRCRADAVGLLDDDRTEDCFPYDHCSGRLSGSVCRRELAVIRKKYRLPCNLEVLYVIL